MAEDLPFTVWMGAKHISIGSTRFDHNKVFFKRIGALPLIDNYVLAMNHTEQLDNLYEEKIWLDNKGPDPKRVVRVYYTDIRNNPYQRQVNPIQIAQNQMLKARIIELENMVEDLQDRLLASTTRDRFQRVVKDNMIFYKEITPQVWSKDDKK